MLALRASCGAPTRSGSMGIASCYKVEKLLYKKALRKSVERWREICRSPCILQGATKSFYFAALVLLVMEVS
jgi:hypothetical protein